MLKSIVLPSKYYDQVNASHVTERPFCSTGTVVCTEQEVPSSIPGLSWLSLVVNCCTLRAAYLHLKVANTSAT